MLHLVVFLLFQAAIRVDKFHIALRHLRHIKDNSVLAGYRNREGQNLLHVLANTTSGSPQLKLKVHFTLDTRVSYKFGKFILGFKLFKSILVSSILV